MEVSGQFHAAAAVLPGKEIAGPILLELRWVCPLPIYCSVVHV